MGANFSTGDVRLNLCNARTPCQQVEEEIEVETLALVATAEGNSNWWCATARSPRNLAYARRELVKQEALSFRELFTTSQHERQPTVCAPSFNQTKPPLGARTTSRDSTTTTTNHVAVADVVHSIRPFLARTTSHSLTHSPTLETTLSLSPSPSTILCSETQYRNYHWITTGSL